MFMLLEVSHLLLFVEARLFLIIIQIYILSNCKYNFSSLLMFIDGNKTNIVMKCKSLSSTQRGILLKLSCIRSNGNQ